MSTKLCRQAIESRLSAWAAARTPALPIAWQNVRYAPTTGASYLRAFLLPATTGSEDLSGDHRRYLGVYQVNVCVPIETGPEAAEAIVGEIAAQFPVNLRITASTVTVQVITPVSEGPADQDATHFIVPASFTYRADTI